MKKLRTLSVCFCLAASLATAACGTKGETTASPPAAQQPAQAAASQSAQSGDSAASEPQPQPTRVRIPDEIAYYIDGMERAQVKQNLVYKTLPNGENLRMDVYLPEDAAEGQKYPAVILIHGRSRNPVNIKSRGQYITWGQLLAKSGMVAVAFNYRLSTYERTPTSYEDIQDLIQYVRDHADSLQIDKDRMAFMTFSASGIAGLYMPLYERPPFIKAMVSYYNWLDLEDLRATNDPAAFEKLNQYAPVTHLEREPEKIAPMLIAKAGKDSDQINKTIDNFVNKAREVKANVELLVHPDGEHGFDFENHDDTSREIIKRTVEFLQEHLLEE